MLGKRGAQRGLFEADNQYLEAVGKESFYAFLAGLRGVLFRDEEFAHLYVQNNGRPSVPPSLLATALLLQAHDRVSDEEAKERADFDVRWKVALGITVEAHPFAKSTLQLFRAQLVVHDAARMVFRKSLELAKKQGFLKQNRKLRLALDTTNILGRGAVKDTYNLLGDGIVLLLRQLALLAGAELAAFATELGYARYVGEQSLKGGAELDWDNAKERARLLAEIVADADRLLAEARKVQKTLPSGSPEALALTKAAELLSQVLLQDIVRSEEGAELRDGVAKDRMPSVHDPEMRHGRKSAQKRFNGHKAQIAVDTDEQLVTAVTVLAGNAPRRRAGAGDGRRDGAEHGLGGGGDRGGLRLRERGDPPRVRQGRPAAGGQGGFHAQRRRLSQDRIHHRHGHRDLRLSGGKSRPRSLSQSGRRKQRSRRKGAGQAAPWLRVRSGDLRSLSAPGKVRAWRGRTEHRRPSPGGPSSTGPGLPAQPGVWRIPQSATGRRTSARPARAARYPPGTLRRAKEDALPAPDGSYGG